MWNHALPDTGHGARTSATTASISTMTIANRSAKKVSGSTYGNPNLAPMKPVLQSATKSKGINASNVLDVAGCWCVAWVMG